MLLSERNPEPGRTHRLQTLSHGGFPNLVALRGRARPNLDDEGGRAFALLANQPARTAQATQPAEPDPDESHPDEAGIDPLYLFGCGLSWRRQHNASAGWELIHCLRSSEQNARIAATLLAEPENMQPPARELARAIDSPPKPSVHSEPEICEEREWRR